MHNKLFQSFVYLVELYSRKHELRIYAHCKSLNFVYTFKSMLWKWHQTPGVLQPASLDSLADQCTRDNIYYSPFPCSKWRWEDVDNFQSPRTLCVDVGEIDNISVLTNHYSSQNEVMFDNTAYVLVSGSPIDSYNITYIVSYSIRNDPYIFYVIQWHPTVTFFITLTWYFT